MNIYDEIGLNWWTGEGVTLKAFGDALDKMPKSVKNIELRVNSPGGDVFDGVGIYNRLKQYAAKNNVKITAYIDGMAASIASIIVLAADEVIMGEGAEYMIHKPWTMAMGNSDDLDAVSQRLLDIEDNMLSIYMKRAKVSRDEVKEMLKLETWMKAEQAIEYGFADKTFAESMPIAASAFDKPWIHRPPRAFNSVERAVRSEATELLKEMDEFLKK